LETCEKHLTLAFNQLSDLKAPELQWRLHHLAALLAKKRGRSEAAEQEMRKAETLLFESRHQLTVPEYREAFLQRPDRRDFLREMET
jgi:hypothetical protein